jgi:dipeptide/tripeptide permease
MMALWFISNALGQGINALCLQFFDESAPGAFFFVYAGAALVICALFFLLRKKVLGLAKL